MGHLEILETPRPGSDCIGKAVYCNSQGTYRNYISFLVSQCRTHFVAWSDALPNEYFGFFPHIVENRILGLSVVLNTGKLFEFILESEIEAGVGTVTAPSDDMHPMNILSV